MRCIQFAFGIDFSISVDDSSYLSVAELAMKHALSVSSTFLRNTNHPYFYPIHDLMVSISTTFTCVPLALCSLQCMVILSFVPRYFILRTKYRKNKTQLDTNNEQHKRTAISNPGLRFNFFTALVSEGTADVSERSSIKEDELLRRVPPGHQPASASPSHSTRTGQCIGETDVDDTRKDEDRTTAVSPMGTTVETAAESLPGKEGGSKKDCDHRNGSEPLAKGTSNESGAWNETGSTFSGLSFGSAFASRHTSGLSRTSVTSKTLLSTKDDEWEQVEMVIEEKAKAEPGTHPNKERIASDQGRNEAFLLKGLLRRMGKLEQRQEGLEEELEEARSLNEVLGRLEMVEKELGR